MDLKTVTNIKPLLDNADLTTEPLSVGATHMHQPRTSLHVRSRALRPVKRELLLSAERIQDVLGHTCCHAQCTAQFTFQKVSAAHQTNANKGESEVTEWAAGMLNATIADGHMQYVIDGHTVCRVAWRLFYGLSDFKLREARSMALGGQLHVERRLTMNEAVSKGWLVYWMQGFFQSVCDPVVAGHCVLPKYITPRTIAEECALAWYTDSEHSHKAAPTVALVHQVMRENFPHVHQPKRGEWGLCRRCSLLGALCEECGANLTLKAQVHALQKIHDQEHVLERHVFEKHRADVERDPGAANLVSIDLTHPANEPNVRPANAVQRF